jgi:hypothetical protein
VRRVPLCALLILAARSVLAQGGPPMITDDPGTPGNGNWENNVAIILEHRPNEWGFDAPGLDLNYGWGDHIQLTLQTAAALKQQADHGLIGGLGGAEVAVKWRFLDEETSGIDMSMFPRILFNVVHSSVRRGLADEGTRFQFPFEAARKFGPVALDLEFGPLVSSVARGEFLYGIVAARELSATTTLMAEVHATSRMNFTREIVTLNVGWRHTLNRHTVWIASLGHEVHSDQGEALALVGYCGLQLLY